ncbi:LuxR C-terminal-related transcriptional regulator [Lipingzhangella sp. LS1_29]|uniref:LuxR C-terminal-related transcriptional regulator n=1 Tax=Lipingzhangella rawalii TaxID=2055835 RepID=A0ABU2H7S2_9ACTN|nr:LuxR C-terminal-related transcriptional regulator [Lipingzhangella rawalii]MDS1271357.1 LuxR C-terminal-related transcriptional regulator [Lipingzhangella rawalii]
MQNSVRFLTHPPTLRGRSRERSRIARLLSGAAAGSGGSLVLSGAPGCGKSALLDAARGESAEHLHLEAAGVPTETTLAYAGLQQLLLPLLERTTMLSGEHGALLRQMLDTGRIADTERFPLSIAVHDLLHQVAQERPLTLTVDDAHLLDPSSLEVLTFVARRIRHNTALVLLCATCDGQSKPVLPSLPQLPVPPLSPDAVAQLVTDAAPIAPTDTVRAELVRAAHGNPRAALSLLGALSDTQLAGQEALPHPMPLGRDIIEDYVARIADLPDSTLQLLHLAATDPELPVDTLVLALDSGTDSVAALEPAEERGVVRVVDNKVEFCDPLLRDAVYQDAPLYRRRAAHAVLAETLGAWRDPARQAWHRAAAARGPDARIASDLAARSESMRSTYGYEASATALERAAELTPMSGTKSCRIATAAHHAWLAGQPHRAQHLLERQRHYSSTPLAPGITDLITGSMALRSDNAIDAYAMLRGAAESLAPKERHLALRALVRAAEAASLAGDVRRYTAAAERVTELCGVDDPPSVRLGTDYVRGSAALLQGNYASAVEPLRRAVNLAAHSADPTELIWSTICALQLGDEAQAHTLATRAVELARESGAVALIPQALEFLVYAEFWTERYPSAVGHCLTGLRLSRETGQSNSAAHLTAALSLLSAIQGDSETCRLRARTATEQAAQNCLGLPRALSTWGLAFLDLSRGEAAQAAYRLRALAHSGTGQSHSAIRVLTIPHFVEAAALNEESDSAAVALNEYARWATTTDSPGPLALLARCRALLASGESSREHFEEALRLHRTGGHDGIEYARTQLLYGTTLRRQRSPRQALDHLHCALEVFEHLDVRLLAARARTELRATGDAKHREAEETAGPSIPLTGQQRQIAELVAEGATNREIAAQLHISPRTVEHHLRNIFRLLQVRSRVELSRLILRGHPDG